MTSTELYQWMTDPSLLTKSSLSELKQMVDDYPFFHAARVLYLKNLSVLDDVRLEKELRKMSVFVPDRTRLFLLINDKGVNGRGDITLKPSVTKENNTDNRLENTFTTPPSMTIAPSDYVNWLETNAEDLPAVVGGVDNRLKRQDLIDSFIKNEGTAFIKRIDNTDDRNTKESEENDEISIPVELEKVSLDDTYFTETLARVYIIQKRYEKALEIIRVLSLKYPEKNIYFADQIRYLEKIINIKK